MSHKLPKITVSIALIAVFALFNVGVPIVKYLCPMMSMENPTCDMSTSPYDGAIAYSTPTPNCCAKYIIAERNTTPYVSIQKYNAPVVEALALAVIAAPAISDLQSSSILAANLSPPHARSSEPLFLLNSSFLI